MFASANIAVRVGSVLTAAVAVAALAGCGTSLPGSGRPASPGSVAASPSAGASSSPAASPSPSATLDAAGIDPCQLISDFDQQRLQVTDHGPADRSDFDGATCRFVVDSDHQFNATATDGVTLDELVAASRGQGRDDTATTIGGLPAATSFDTDEPVNCTAAVGVSDTGMVVVTYQDLTATTADRAATCGRATDIAEAALTGLRAQQ